MSHAPLPPSGWDRWSVCPGSVEAEKGLPDTTSPYADEGTAAHIVLENVLRNKYVNRAKTDDHPGNYIGKQINVADEGQEPRHVTVNQEMVDAVATVVQYIKERVDDMRLFGPVEVRAEERVNPGKVIGSDHLYGTADVTLVSDYLIELIDLKYGRGIVVEVKNNGQLGLYMLGVLAEYGFPNQIKVPQYRLTIAQPRAWHPDGPIRSQEWKRQDAIDFTALAADAVRAVTPDAPRVGGEKACRWCKAKPTCPEAMQAAGDAIGAPRLDQAEVLQAFASASVDRLTPAQIVQILHGADFVKGFLTAVEEYAHAQLKSGNAPPEIASAYKLVEGMTRRAWVKEAQESIIKAIQAITSASRSTLLKKAPSRAM